MIRDVSLASQQKHRVIVLIRDLARWIAESRVAANFLVEEPWTHIQSGSPMTTSDPKEIWALEIFCNKLSEKGWLVPLSKKFVCLSCWLPTLTSFKEAATFPRRYDSQQNFYSLMESTLRTYTNSSSRFPFCILQMLCFFAYWNESSWGQIWPLLWCLHSLLGDVGYWKVAGRFLQLAERGSVASFTRTWVLSVL